MGQKQIKRYKRVLARTMAKHKKDIEQETLTYFIDIMYRAPFRFRFRFAVGILFKIKNWSKT